mgnify:CR=1 FL=1
MALRKRISPEEFFRERNSYREERKDFELSEETKERLKELFQENEGSKQAILLDRYLNYCIYSYKGLY